ncbi:hypothetical protein A5724_05630 [Mycobacterium sp. ACS1612]|uniref:DUF4185 domain-containing protein n=1 Tax=Mycobacterium sp. ACS1612 TaxID=1834117 RepID=UPI0007FECF0F|nr:DUF4185 domain-containing protein [Mycobacterium sp. ACS1612]OBF41054.1 hypothetical protein A5724_05630 [Mycobacterium sp. ACS1612]
MGAAAFVGRVGGLAVALGVGTAIAAGYGVAAADTTASDPPSDTSAPSGSTETETKTTTHTETTSDSAKDTAGSEDTKATTEPVKGVVTAQTNTGTSGSTPTKPTIEPEPTTEPEPTKPTTEPESTKPTTEPEPESESESETPEPSATAKPTGTKKASTKKAGTREPSTKAAATSAPTPTKRAAQSVADPAVSIQSAESVAVFADARTLAAASLDVPTPRVPTAPQNPLTAVTKLVSNVIGFALNPLAGNAPITPAQPPLIWSLLAFARREFDNFFAALAGGATDTASPVQRLTSLALAALVPDRPHFPSPGQQLSPSTNFVDWVTGNFLPNNTDQRFDIWGTDVGVMWDNGILDDPKTTINEHQVLIAVGDTFGGDNMSGYWRNNTILRSGDLVLGDGMSIPDGEWFNGNMFGGAPLNGPTSARPVIFKEILPAGLPTGVTLIPTAGISLQTPGTTYGATQYMSFMSVKQWGNPGSWSTNYSAIAYSVDNGENWLVAPTSVRMNSGGNKNFQQQAFVMGNDGYVYAYGTPNGRQGAAYVSRVLPQDILDVSKYEYYSKGTRSWFSSTPAGWYKNAPSKATSVFGKESGACGVAKAGNTVSEMSVQYNKSLNKYVVLYGDQFNNIVIRTADSPQGKWSTAKTILNQQNGGIYAPMMHPWSPSTMGTGTDLYWNLSLWSEYNVMLMRTDLTKV